MLKIKFLFKLTIFLFAFVVKYQTAAFLWASFYFKFDLKYAINSSYVFVIFSKSIL